MTLTNIRTAAFTLIVAVLLPASLAAQVGFPPEESPYRDQTIGQTLTVFTGYLSPGRDPASVAPDPSMLFGLRYDVGIGGPSAMYGRYIMAPSKRLRLAPSEPAATRVESTPSVTTHMFEIGLDISLTGRKSWHNLMPSVTAGLGIASDFEKADIGGYKFGTQFLLGLGAAVRYVPGGRLSYRASINNFLWQYDFPDAYFVPASDNTSILTETRHRSSWRSNWGVTVGVSWLLFR